LPFGSRDPPAIRPKIAVARIPHFAEVRVDAGVTHSAVTDRTPDAMSESKVFSPRSATAPRIGSHTTHRPNHRGHS